MINVCNNSQSSSLTVLIREVLVNPHHNVVLKGTFYDLVEKIR